jgi:ABC-2 type transport system permease protein
MNIRGGWALVKKSLMGYMASSGFFWTLAIAWMVAPLVYLFVWLTVAGPNGVNGFDRNDFVLYYLAVIMVNQITYPVSHWTIGEAIRAGSMSVWLLRPIPVLYEAVAADLAVKMVCVPFVFLVVIVLGWALSLQVAIGWGSVCLFLVILALSQILRFLFGYALALLAFWTDRIDALLVLTNTFVFLFAGQVAPVALLPGLMQQFAIAAPFRYMLGFPVEVLLGKLQPFQLMTGLIWQMVWVGVVMALYLIIWRRGIKMYSAIGG